MVMIVLYFGPFRGVRAWVHDGLMGTLLPAEHGPITNTIQFDSNASVSFNFFYSHSKDPDGWQFKIPFGAFFLFSIIGLVAISAGKNSYLLLVLLHFLGGVMSLCCVWLGIHVQPYFLVVPDFLGRYLLPLGSLGLVAITLVLKKAKRTNA